MATKTSVKKLLQELAKERGLEIADSSKIDESPKGGGVTSKLERGAGFTEAFRETTKEKYQAAKEAITTTKGIKSVGKKVYMEMFSGQDIFSAYMRGRLKGGDEKSLMKGSGTGDLGGDASQYLTIIAKESMAIPGMAKDTNVMRQNLQQLVKIWGGQAATKRESVEEREKDISFFAGQDKKEAELEASRVKATPSAAAPGGTVSAPAQKGDGLLDTIISLFSGGFMKAIKTIFSPKILMKVFSKVFIPLTIIATLFNGIMDGFKRYQETGSFSEAIVAGLGGMLNFLSFGLFGEDTLRNLFDSVSKFFAPVMETVRSIFGGIKDFFVKLFGGDVDVKSETLPPAAKVTPGEPPREPGAPAKTDAAAPAAPPPAAPASSAPSKVPAPAKQDLGPRKQSSESKKLQEQQQAEANADALEELQGELQGIYADWRAEKGAAMEKLVNSRAKFSDDPKAPNYPIELKAIDDKYNKLISAKKDEIESLKKKPGVQEALKRRNAEDKRFDDLEKEAKTPTKVGGMKYTTTEKVETTGGGETTTKIKLTPEAQKAKEELTALEKKQADERREAVAKAKSEGKIKGRFATSTDFEEVGELKALKTRQEAEREALIKKINEGTSTEVTKTGGTGGSISAEPAGGGASSSVTPSATPSTTSPSGSQIAAESSNVAEGQRMESSAEQGSVINAPTTNKSGQVAGRPSSKTSEVYNSDLATMLATT